MVLSLSGVRETFIVDAERMRSSNSRSIAASWIRKLSALYSYRSVSHRLTSSGLKGSSSVYALEPVLLSDSDFLWLLCVSTSELLRPLENIFMTLALSNDVREVVADDGTGAWPSSDCRG